LRNTAHTGAVYKFCRADIKRKGVFSMKNRIKIVGIIALAAVIGFIMVACSKGGGRASPVSDFKPFQILQYIVHGKLSVPFPLF